MTYLLGIDLGSTNLNAIIFDSGGNVVSKSSRPTEKHVPNENPDWVIWKPDQIWSGTAEAIKEATPLGAATLAGIGVGVYQDVEDAYDQVKKPGDVYTPDKELTALYNDRYGIYRELYSTLKPINHQINRIIE